MVTLLECLKWQTSIGAHALVDPEPTNWLRNRLFDIMVISDAPESEEHGSHERLLYAMLSSIGLTPDQFFVATLTPSPPPAERFITYEEARERKPFLVSQIQRIKPKFLLLLGQVVTQTFIENARYPFPLDALYHPPGLSQPIIAIPTFHLSYLFAHPEEKKTAWRHLLHLKHAHLR